MAGNDAKNVVRWVPIDTAVANVSKLWQQSLAAGQPPTRFVVSGSTWRVRAAAIVFVVMLALVGIALIFGTAPESGEMSRMLVAIALVTILPFATWWTVGWFEDMAQDRENAFFELSNKLTNVKSLCKTRLALQGDVPFICDDGNAAEVLGRLVGDYSGHNILWLEVKQTLDPVVNAKGTAVKLVTSVVKPKHERCIVLGADYVVFRDALPNIPDLLIQPLVSSEHGYVLRKFGELNNVLWLRQTEWQRFMSKSIWGITPAPHVQITDSLVELLSDKSTPFLQLIGGHVAIHFRPWSAGIPSARPRTAIDLQNRLDVAVQIYQALASGVLVGNP